MRGGGRIRGPGACSPQPEVTSDREYSIDVVTLVDRGVTAGYVVLQHGLSFAKRRALDARNFMMLLFATFLA
ncbi:MAG TPA: hypothetical protein VFH51_20650, partial [Myxococcota bacterium]|nr:hypothetical protein [Myxococcota bacterium]